MYLAADSIDDLLHAVFEKLLRSSNRVSPTRGPTTELNCVLLKLTNPRLRLSRTEMKGTLFSCLGELLWYLAGSGSLQFIAYYLPRYNDESEDGRSIHGAYGPRLFNLRGNNQINNVLHLLKSRDTSRRAVIQLFDASDLALRSGKPRKEIPCTCTLQFLVRDGQLHLLTNMRSNDAYKGLPHDVFCFTMIQELFARSLGLELGAYSHAVGSLHLYVDDVDNAKSYLEEGWQMKIPMDPMPRSDPWPSIRSVLRAEAKLRAGNDIDVSSLKLPPYWADVVRLLQIFRHTKRIAKRRLSKRGKVRVLRTIASLKKEMASDTYGAFIAKRQARVDDQPPTPQQMRLADL